MFAIRVLLSSVFCVVAVCVSSAWAVQSHGGAEGLVAHQIGHLLFFIGMGYLLLRLYHLQQKGNGWTEFRAFLWLILAWNLQTFWGHWLNESVPAERFGRLDGDLVSFSVVTGSDLLYYFTQLDHLLLVPAFLFLLLALRKWRRQS